MKYRAGTIDPKLRVPVPTIFDRVVWFLIGFWFNILGPLFVWLRWRKKNSFIGQMAAKWAFLGTVAEILALIILFPIL